MQNLPSKMLAGVRNKSLVRLGRFGDFGDPIKELSCVNILFICFFSLKDSYESFTFNKMFESVFIGLLYQHDYLTRNY